jgi:hypothetical protein
MFKVKNTAVAGFTWVKNYKNLFSELHFLFHTHTQEMLKKTIKQYDTYPNPLHV